MQADLTVTDHPNVYVVGDIANIPDAERQRLPAARLRRPPGGRLGGQEHRSPISTAKPRTPFAYHDKGIMAMIGRNAAIAEMGEHRHELHGPVAFAAWLGVHAWLMSGTRQRVDAFISWAWDYFRRIDEPEVLDSSDAAQHRLGG